ncbi:lysophospholipid acyltransferase family protein [Salinimicrobium sediminilitoris]|uniref:lysophospholipid acyltransferase family protein n=1 Tax=Salinimicrobium sediminilitoris TaxID=2876715 RepID=UPI001E2FBF30|nr:lysophospholipid acyltransferase family protein [Salinimicrobium sediminilitoris]MCC8359635.1 1-acyl-sn-glycerol-3-phosphate acyltransferase [Salinimicrobium sediminilitoris]
MKKFKKIFSYPISVIFLFFFFLTLLIFHPIQWISLKLGGYEGHKKSVDALNFFLLRCLNLLGTRFTIENPYNLPTNRSCIFVSNHQGTYDIPPIIWHFRKHHPKFVSKKELGKGIPSISYNLRHGGNLLIDRKKGRESMIAMSKFADYLNEHKRSAVIFPEGTRSRTGAPKKFAVKGLQLLIEKMPDALVVPITINNSWKLFRYGNFPMGIGVHFKLKVHEPIAANSEGSDALVAQVERTITAEII